MKDPPKGTQSHQGMSAQAFQWSRGLPTRWVRARLRGHGPNSVGDGSYGKYRALESTKRDDLLVTDRSTLTPFPGLYARCNRTVTPKWLRMNWYRVGGKVDKGDIPPTATLFWEGRGSWNWMYRRTRVR